MPGKKTKNKAAKKRTKASPKAAKKETKPARRGVTAGAGKGSVATGRPRHEEVAREAYLIWRARGCAHGHDLDDWLAAEDRLRRESPAA